MWYFSANKVPYRTGYFSGNKVPYGTGYFGANKVPYGMWYFSANKVPYGTGYFEANNVPYGMWYFSANKVPSGMGYPCPINGAVPVAIVTMKQKNGTELAPNLWGYFGAWHQMGSCWDEESTEYFLLGNSTGILFVACIRCTSKAFYCLIRVMNRLRHAYN